jgi:hypothetical protein
MLASPEPGSDRAVLEDATGRRGRWMRRAGRTATLLVFAWLVVLLLGGLGLAPVANLPFAETLRPSKGPEPLAVVPKPRKPRPIDLQPAAPIATRAIAPNEASAALTPVRTSRTEPARRERRFAAKPRAGTRSAPRQTAVPQNPARPVPPATTPIPPAPTPAASRGRSAQAPGHTGGPPPGQTATSPGRIATAPGQVKKTTTTTTTVTTTVTTTTHGPKEPKKP